MERNDQWRVLHDSGEAYTRALVEYCGERWPTFPDAAALIRMLWWAWRQSTDLLDEDAVVEFFQPTWFDADEDALRSVIRSEYLDHGFNKHGEQVRKAVADAEDQGEQGY